MCVSGTLTGLIPAEDVALSQSKMGRMQLGTCVSVNVFSISQLSCAAVTVIRHHPWSLAYCSISFVVDSWNSRSYFIVWALDLFGRLPKRRSGKESACWCRRCKFDPWVVKTPWRREGQPTPVFLPRKIPWTEELGSLEFTGSQRVGHDSAPLIGFAQDGYWWTFLP